MVISPRLSPMRNYWYLVLPLFLCEVLGIFFILPGICHGADMLEYDAILQKSLNNSHDVGMSRLDIGISQASLKKAYSLYYPTLRAQWNTEYAENLGEDEFFSSDTIGDSTFVRNTVYQSALSLKATYNAFSFGAVTKRVGIARYDVDAKKKTHLQTVRDIKVKVLKIYADLLTAYRELETKVQLLAIYEDLSLTKKRLYKAGKVSKLEMIDQMIKATRTADEIERVKLSTAKLLNDLGFFTGENYSSNNFRISDFNEIPPLGEDKFDITKTPESRIYALEIEKKQNEIDALKREQLPKIDLYSNYIWYGSNPNEAMDSADGMRARNWVVGMVATMSLFDGFRMKADIDKAKIELERLKLEKARKLLELSQRHAKLVETKKTFTTGIEYQTELLKKVTDKLAMVERLAQQKIINRVEYLDQKVDLLEQGLELKKVVIAKIAASKELDILSQGVD